MAPIFVVVMVLPVFGIQNVCLFSLVLEDSVVVVEAIPPLPPFDHAPLAHHVLQIKIVMEVRFFVLGMEFVEVVVQHAHLFKIVNLEFHV